MKKLITFLAAVLLIVSVFIMIVEHIYRGYRNPVDRLFATYNKYRSTTEVLYIGNSHVGAFKPVLYADRARLANMAIGGQDIYRMYTVVSTLVPQTPGLKKVVMNVDYDLIGYNQVKNGQEYIDRQYYPYVHQLYAESATARALASSAFFRSNRDLSYLLHPHAETGRDEEVDFIPVAERGGAKTTDGCKKRAKEHTVMKFNDRYIDQNLSYLAAIDSICRASQVALILITTPKTECYRAYSDVSNITKAKAKLDSLVGARGVMYHDFYLDHDFTDSDFVDYDHLNPTGVRLLLSKIDSIR